MKKPLSHVWPRGNLFEGSNNEKTQSTVQQAEDQDDQNNETFIRRQSYQVL
jgi:hypothetical protein